MTKTSWTLATPIDAICFDCDGTLSAIEGINELARFSQVTEQVEALTTIAMSETGINPGIYEERLRLVNPTREHLINLAHEYFENRAPDVAEVIALYQRLNKSVYLISAGLNPAVELFGKALNIPVPHIFAVDLEFDEEGKYITYDINSSLVHNDGKRLIINHLKKQHRTIAHIGDGLNDVATHDLVSRFIGYGGFYYREHISKLCQFYIRSRSLAAMLPLTLTLNELSTLTTDEQTLYQKGLNAIKEGTVKVQAEI